MCDSLTGMTNRSQYRLMCEQGWGTVHNTVSCVNRDEEPFTIPSHVWTGMRNRSQYRLMCEQGWGTVHDTVSCVNGDEEPFIIPSHMWTECCFLNVMYIILYIICERYVKMPTIAQRFVATTLSISDSMSALKLKQQISIVSIYYYIIRIHYKLF